MESKDIPDVLKKTYTTNSLYGFKAALNMVESQTVSNPWVSDTPGEFRKKLVEAFNEGSVKSIILNLVTDVSDDIIAENQQAPERSEDQEYPNET
ncbi:MAG: hypothetical protein Q8R09_00630, partial [Anaerolineaceae bacterium]|nr:hypothetical protein [Anaerolineaceae bacterium]